MRGAPPADAADSGWVFHADEEAVFAALANGDHAESLREYFGAVAYAELGTLAGAALRVKRPRGPRVLILPGIMGSRLGRAVPPAVPGARAAPAARPGPARPGAVTSPAARDVVWIDPLQIAAGRLAALKLPPDLDRAGQPIQPMGVLLQAYAKLSLTLRIAGCRTSFYAYDWRLGIDALGSALALSIAACGEPVNVVAHSMGGLIARVAARQLAKRHLRKLIMLGTPNQGSFAPVQALRGTYPFVRQVASLDQQHSADTLAAEVFNTFPGIYHLLPPPRAREQVDLLDPQAWPVGGPAPRACLLAQVKAARAQLASPDARMFHIIGVNQTTVVTVRRTAAGFEYGSSRNGDGTVPAVRARMKRLKAYFVEESHGNLPGNLKVIRAILDLLRRGRTGALVRHWTPRRETLRHVDDAALRLNHSRKIDWRLLNSAQREAALGELDRGAE